MDKIVSKVHPFERTLGAGPFKFSHLVIINAGERGVQICGDTAGVERGIGTCAHCGHGIMNCYIIRIGNGKLFGVGSDCILKVGFPAPELTKIQKEIKEHQRKLRAARKEKQLDKSRKEDEASLALFSITWAKSEFRSLMEKQPHPNEYFTKAKGLTLADYIDWNFERKNAKALRLVMVQAEAFEEKKSKPLKK